MMGVHRMRKYLVSYWMPNQQVGSIGFGNCDVSFDGMLTIERIREIERTLNDIHKLTNVVVINIILLEG
jgi:hypothetical protein